jgi:hypothetical protein
MAESEITRRVKEELPGKVLTFYRGLALCAPARAAMEAAGFTPAVRAQGWSLLETAVGCRIAPLVETDAKARAAYVEVDRTDEPFFARTSAALEHHHPEQAAFVFENLAPSQGYSSVLGLSMLLDRLNTLEQGRSDATREADRAAIATLSERGITPQERARLAELVKVAKVSMTPSVMATTADIESESEKALVELQAWFSDWSRTARAVVQKRSHLIRLGLAKRRSPKKGEEAESSDAATTPAKPAVS